MKSLQNSILPSILEALEEAKSSDYVRAYASKSEPSNRHQFLFFAKPEVFDASDGALIEARLELLLDKIESFDLSVEEAIVLTGRFLGKHRIVSEHYGVIDRIARNPATSVSENGRNKFEETYGLRFDEAPVVGGIGYLRMRPDLTPEGLSRSWLEAGYEKMSGGCYCHYLEGEKLYLFNGFYPKLLKHYTRRGARIAVFVLSGDVAWSEARRVFAGATDPASAEEGSIRRTLLERAESLGIAEVSANLNGVHLSAGPVEALVELLRFTDSRDGHGRTADSFRFGRELVKRFGRKPVSRILTNPDMTIDGQTVSIFDLTEELDAETALVELERVSDQLR